MTERLEIILVAYDISDTRRLRKVARVCEAYGTRVQLSVFELQLKPGQLEIMQAQMRRIIDPRVDKIRYYRICASDYFDIRIEGVGVRAAPHRYTVV